MKRLLPARVRPRSDAYLTKKTIYWIKKTTYVAIVIVRSTDVKRLRPAKVRARSHAYLK